MSDEIVKKEKESSLEVRIDNAGRPGLGIIESLRIDPEKTGHLLSKIANQRVEKWFLEEVSRQIEELIKHKNNLLINAQKLSDELKLTERRLAAIDAGEIEIGWNGKVHFKEAILNFY